MKTRADILLVAGGYCDSRTEAQKLICAGRVRVGTDALVHKASDTFPDGTVFQVSRGSPFVSRGAQKLLAAIEHFKPVLVDGVALDIGASTGGFTDLLLQQGCRRVYAVDVGKGQLHHRLRQDPRVVCLEGVNARYLRPEQIPELVDVLTADVSFISLRKALGAPARFLKTGGWAFLLVKPQFEAGRAEVGKGGVVRDEAVRLRCVHDVAEYLRRELSWQEVGFLPSPILGPAGNQEYVLVLRVPAPG